MKKLLELTSNKSEIYTEMADFEFIYGFYQQAFNHYSLASNLTNYRYNNLAISYWKLGKKDDVCIYFSLSYYIIFFQERFLRM